MDKSQGQLQPQNDFANIEQEIMNEIKKKKQKNPKDANLQITLDKISPALVQLQNISHHNLYVAQTYQSRAQNLEEQLKRLIIENEGLKEMFDQMKNYYDKKINDDEQLINKLEKEKQHYYNGYIVLEQKNKEYEQILNESKNFIEEQKKIIQFLERQYKDAWDKYQKDCEKLQQIVGKANTKISQQSKQINDLKLQMINEGKTAENKIQQLEQSNRNYQINLDELNKKYNSKENQWKVDAIESEKRLVLLNERNEQINDLKKENEKLRNDMKVLEFRNQQINEQMEQLKEKFDQKVAEKMKDISDNFSRELTKKDLEIASLYETVEKINKEKKTFIEQNNKKDRQLSENEQILNDLNNQLEIEQQQIQDFNNHYENIKDKYEILVRNLQKELSNLQQKNLKITDDYETCQSQLETLKKKEELFENFRKFKQDETYITLLKNASDDVYLKNIKQEDLDSIKFQAKDEVFKDKMRNKLMDQYEENEKNQKFLLLQKDEEGESDGELNNQWDELTRNLNKFKSEVTNSEFELQQKKEE